jgi:excisionase family DNA binding protein
MQIVAALRRGTTPVRTVHGDRTADVSRPFLVKQLEAGEIPFHKVGRHRRIRFSDLMDYRDRIDREGSEAADELAAQAQELGLGY